MSSQDFISLFFTFHGRVRRLPFFLSVAALWVVSSLLWIILGLFVVDWEILHEAAHLEGEVFSELLFEGTTRNITAGWIVALIGVILLQLPLLWAYTMLCIKRLHDIGWTGWLSAMSFIPYLQVIIWPLMLFAPGTAGSNRYDLSARARPRR